MIGVIDGIVVAGASAFQSPSELPVRGYRGLSADARVLSIYEGANDIQNLVIPRALARSDRCERPCRCEFIRTLKGGASLNVRLKSHLHTGARSVRFLCSTARGSSPKHPPPRHTIERY